MTLSRVSGLGALAFGVLLSGAARADEPKVEINTQSILASNDGQGVEPASLAAMKDKFSKEGFAFTSFKELKQQALVLAKGREVEVKLPNGQDVHLRLDDVVGGVAKIHVRLPPIDTTYTLGREGSVFIDGGHHQKGTLVFVLSPADAARHK